MEDVGVLPSRMSVPTGLEKIEAAAFLPPPLRVSRRLARPRSPQLDAFRKPEVSSTGSSDSQSYRPLHITSFLSPERISNERRPTRALPEEGAPPALSPRRRPS